jgi:hypothetical protein
MAREKAFPTTYTARVQTGTLDTAARTTPNVPCLEDAEVADTGSAAAVGAGGLAAAAGVGGSAAVGVGGSAAVGVGGSAAVGVGGSAAVGVGGLGELGTAVATSYRCAHRPGDTACPRRCCTDRAILAVSSRSWG